MDWDQKGLMIPEEEILSKTDRFNMTIVFSDNNLPKEVVI